VVKREQHYLDSLKPEYNVLQLAGSLLGFKHSEETLEFFKNERKISDIARQKLSVAASNRVLTDSEKETLSKARLGIKYSDITLKRMSEAATLTRGVQVIVENIETKEEKTYPSLTQAADDLGVSRAAIKKSCVKGSVLKKMYQHLRCVRTKEK